MAFSSKQSLTWKWDKSLKKNNGLGEELILIEGEVQGQGAILWSVEDQ